MILKRISNGPGKEIRFTLVNPKAIQCVDIREYRQLETGSWEPTDNGAMESWAGVRDFLIILKVCGVPLRWEYREIPIDRLKIREDLP